MKTLLMPAIDKDLSHGCPTKARLVAETPEERMLLDEMEAIINKTPRPMPDSLHTPVKGYIDGEGVVVTEMVFHHFGK